MHSLRPLIFVALATFFIGCNPFTSRPNAPGGNESGSQNSTPTLPTGTAGALEPVGPMTLPTPTGCLRELYVATSGSDNNSGLAGSPWQTLQHASDQVQPGDCVFVSQGSYAGFAMGWSSPQSGTASAPIVFQGEPGAVINAQNPDTQDGIDLEGASYVTIENFEVLGQGRAGIRAVSGGTGNSVGVVIRHNYSHDNGDWGIFTSHVDKLLIEYNQAAGSKIQHGIYVSNACVSPVVRGNEIWGNAACGLHMNGDISQGGNGIIVGALVERNIIHDNGSAGGSAINGDGIQGSVIQDNVLYNNHSTGVALFQTDAAEPPQDNVVVNNTILEATDGRFDVEIGDGTDASGNPVASTGNFVLNNILYNYNSSHGSITVGPLSAAHFESDYNLVVGNFSNDGDNTTIPISQWQSSTGQDAHSIVITDVAALFTSLGNNNFHLAPGSPALNAGTSAKAPGYDYEGTSWSTGVNIGAY